MIDLTTYQLGILWCISSINPDGKIVLRSKNRYFLEQIQKTFPNKIYMQESNTNIQYALKFHSPELLSLLDSLGYTNRNSDIRFLPQCADRDFLKAYLEVHSSVDWQTCYSRGKDRKKYYITRLRLYGNYKLMEDVNILMHTTLGTYLHKVQNINDKTAYLSIGSCNDIERILSEYLDDEIKFNPFWNKLKEFHENSPKLKK